MAPKTAFKPGNNANPKGRPKKGTALTDLLKLKLDRDAFVARVIEHAMSNDPKEAAPYVKLIWESIDGKPQQTIVNHNIDVTALSDDELKRLAEGK